MRFLLSIVGMATLLACHSSDSVDITTGDTTDAGSWVGYNEHRPITCGDGICDLDEDTINCVADCGTLCGDGVCNGLENISLCPADCEDSGTGNVDENPGAADCSGCLSEATDCETSCLDKGFDGGFCGAPGSQNPAVCCVCTGNGQPSGPGTVCGDGACDDGENNDNCADDCEPECGPSPHYGLVDGKCLPSCGQWIGEKGGGDGTCCQNGCSDGSQAPGTTFDCNYCCPGADSCSAQATSCGDGACNGGENTATCSMDCGSSCGDGVCNGGENGGDCPADCSSAIASGTNVILLSEAWNQYCAAEGVAEHRVMCSQAIAGPWEQYKIENVNGTGPLHSGDTVGIVSTAWNKYCAAEDIDNHVMHCNRDAPGPWEKYVISKVSGGGPINTGDTVSFRAVEWNTYCSAEGSGGHQIRCNAGSVGASERFQLLLGTEPVTEVPGPNPGPICGDGECNGGESQNNCPGDCGSPPPVSNGCTTVLGDSLAGGTSGSKDGGSFSGGGWKAPHQIEWDLGQSISEGSFSVEVTNWNPNSDSSQHQHGKQQIINMYEESHGSSWDADSDSPKSSYFNIRTGASYDNCYKFLSSTGGFAERHETRAKKPHGTISPGETHTLSVVWTADGTITSYLDGNEEVVHHHGKPFAFRYVFIGTDNTIPGTYGPQHGVVYKNLVVNSGNTGPDADCGP